MPTPVSVAATSNPLISFAPTFADGVGQYSQFGQSGLFGHGIKLPPDGYTTTPGGS